MSEIQKNSNTSNAEEPIKSPILAVIKSFAKIGFIGFGGGSALIPVIEKEVCEDNDYIDPDEYSNFTVISNITPGALPVKLGALIGYKMAGNAGMFLAALLTSIPGVFITLILLALIDILGSSAVHTLEQAAIGISVFIIFLLVSYISKIMRESKKVGFLTPTIVLMLSTFFLTFGKEIRLAISRLGFETSFIETVPIFDISTINMLILLFFIIFFTGGELKGLRFNLGIAISLVYILMFGKSGIINLGIGNTIFQVVIMLVAVGLLIYDSKQDTEGRAKVRLDWGGATKKSLPFLISTTTIFAICFVISSENLAFYLLNGVMSIVTCFGGGPLFITVTEGIFVENGIINSNDFYSQMVPISNAVPGSIVVKLLASVGFVIGTEVSVAYAFLVAILGMMIATTTSCVVCIYVAEIYTSFSYLGIFKILKLWVLPVICGLLLSTILSMLNEVFHIATANNLGEIPMFGLIFGIYAMVYFLHKKFHMNDVLLIIISAVVSVAGVMFLR